MDISISIIQDLRACAYIYSYIDKSRSEIAVSAAKKRKFWLLSGSFEGNVAQQLVLPTSSHTRKYGHFH